MPALRGGDQSVEEMPWPRETSVYFDILDAGRRVALDIDLPEIEDMPAKVAAVTGRGFEIKFNEMSATKVRQLYMRHVHAVGFRVVGEVMASPAPAFKQNFRHRPGERLLVRAQRPRSHFCGPQVVALNRRGPCWICMGRARMGDRSPGAPPR